MSSNLRSKPVEGHVTDSAGNVLRNSQIIVKLPTPYGSVTVDTIKSDDDGYFQTKPLPNGVYDIYESGVSIARTIHSSDRNALQGFRPSRDNYDTTLVKNFLSLAGEIYPVLNGFTYFLQIEPEEMDVSVFGSSFPIYNEESNFDVGLWDTNIATNTDETNEIYNIAKFFNFTPDSRITTTRFDIEYFAPLTELSSYYKRIRWAGVPGIKFSKDSKLVVPLDYFSIVASLPKQTSNYVEANAIEVTETMADKKFSLHEGGVGFADFQYHADRMIIGDIIRITVMGDSGGEGPFYIYGLVVSVIKTDPWTVIIEKWLSSRFVTDAVLGTMTDPYVLRVESFDGMFQGITDINDDVNERFTVVENINAQNYVPELYNYNNRGWLVQPS